MDEDTLIIDFLEGLSPADFSRILSRRRNLANHLPVDKSHIERVSALVDYVRSSGGPGIRWLVNQVKALFPNAGPFSVDEPCSTHHCAAPPLPAHFIPHPDVTDDLKARLLSNAPGAPGALVISALQGQGGIGKSTLAIALAHDPETQARFPDGIFWVTLGQTPDLLPLLSNWIQGLGDYDFKPTTPASATTHLRNHFREKAALLIVDDAWDEEHIQAFRAGGTHCRMLITTRLLNIAESIGARLYSLEELTLEESLQLIAARLDRPLEKHEQPEALQFAELVGHLPLALELGAGRVANGVSWESLTAAFNQEVARLESLDTARTRSRGETRLEANFNISLNALRQFDEDAWDAFLWLGLLPEDALIAAPMAAHLWRTDEPTAARTLELLRNDSLLLQGQDVRIGRHLHPGYRLHDIPYHIARRRLIASEPEGLGITLVQAHRTLLERYKTHCQHTADGRPLWYTIPYDGYIHSQLTAHMLKAECPEEIDKLLREETPEGRNAWYVTCEKWGGTAGFLLDIARAGNIAAERNRHRIASGQPAEHLSLELRYALIRASINSLAAGIPPLLIQLLITDGKWSLAQALAFIGQIPERKNRVEALCQLAPLLTNSERQKTLELAWEAATGISQDFFRIKSLTLVASMSAQAGNISMALKVANDITKTDSQARALTQVALSLVQAGDIAGALEVVDAIAHTITNEHFQAEALSEIASVMVQTENINEALEVADKLAAIESRAKALCQIAALLAQAENISKALEVTDKITFEDSYARSLTHIASHMTGVQRQEILDKALETTNAIPNNYSRAEICSDIASVFAQAGNIPSALEVANTIANKDIRAYTLAQIASHMTGPHRQETLYRAWEMMSATSHSYSQRKTLTLIALLLAQTGNINTALEAVNSIPEESLRAQALSQVASSLVQGGDICGALEVSDAISITSITEHFRAEALSNIAFALAQQGDFSKASDVAERIANDTRRAQALSQIAQSLAQVGDSEKALEVTKSITHDGIQTRTLTEVVLLLVQQGNIPSALEVANTIANKDTRANTLAQIASHMTGVQRQETVSRALEGAIAVSDETAAGNVLNLVAYRLAQIGNISKAQEVTEAITNEYYRVQALMDIASQTTGAQRQEILLSAWHIANTTVKGTFRQEMLPQVIFSFAQAGEVSIALELSASIFEDAIRANALTQIASSLEQTGNLVAACDVIKTIPWEHHDGEILPHFVSLIVEVDGVSEGRKFTATISNEFLRTGILSHLAHVLAQKGNMRNALAIANTIPIEDARVQALLQVASEMTGSQHLKTLRNACKLAKNIPENNSRAYLLSQIAPMIAKAGSIKEALKTAYDIPEGDSQIRTLTQIAQSLILAGDYNTILNLADTISNTSHRIILLTQVASRLTDIERQKTLHKAWETANTIANQDSRAEELTKVAQSFAQAGDCDKAIEITNAILDKSHRTQTLIKLAPYIAQSGDYKTALDIAKNAIDSSVRKHTISIVAQRLTRAGDHKAAIDVAKSISDESHQSTVLFEVASTLIKVGDIGNALEVTKVIDSDEHRTRALLEVATALAHMQQDSDVHLTLAAIKTIHSSIDRLNIYHRLRNHLSRETAYQHWRDILPNISEKQRSTLLQAIPQLAELTDPIQEPDFLAQTATAIRDVTRWWP